MRLKLLSFDKLALGAWVLLAALAAGMRAGLLSLGTVESHVPLCLFRVLTGISCPGCGMAHAILLAFQGRWAESFRYHPLGIPLLGFWTLWILHGMRNTSRGRVFSEGFPLEIRGAVSGALLLGLVLAVYCLRLSGSFG